MCEQHILDMSHYRRWAIVPGAEYEIEESRGRKLGFVLTGDITSLSQDVDSFALKHQGLPIVLMWFSNLAQIEEATGCSYKDRYRNQ